MAMEARPRGGKGAAEVEEVRETDAGVKRGAAMPMVATAQRGDGESGS
jgi:hypothetical protein